MDERVAEHQCVPCEADLTNAPGDDASGPDTTCDDACAAVFGVPCDEHFEAYVKAQAPTFNFGFPVAIHDATAAIRHSQGVDILRRDDSEWVYQTTLVAPPDFDDPALGSFGRSLAIHGDTLAVGHGTSFGHVHIYERATSGEWTYKDTLQGDNTEFGDRFGASLALEGPLVVVGAGGEDSAALGVNGDASDNSATDSGAAYIFRRTDGTWAQEAYLKASNTAAGAGFGVGVSISGDTIVIGAPGESSGIGGINPPQDIAPAVGSSGAAYVFVHRDGAWTQQAHIKAESPRENEGFGARNDLEGDTLIIGDPRSNDYSGRVYFFERADEAWTLAQTLEFTPPSSQPQPLPQTGFQVKIHGDLAFASAPFFRLETPGYMGDPYGATFPVPVAGGVFVLRRTPMGWVLQSTVMTAPFPQPETDYGSIAVDAPYLIVGARKEPSAALGINGDPTDTTAPESGAAYIYRIAP